MEPIKQPIFRVSWSPKQPQRWEVELDCGHRITILQKNPPLRQAMACPRCEIKLRYSPTPDQR
jgi:hypothetical protein